MNMSSPSSGDPSVKSVPAVLRAVVLAAQLAAGVVRRAGWVLVSSAQQRVPGAAGGEPMYNNRNDGPPDLDELWRDFNRKLSGVFSGKDGGGSGDQGPGGSMTPDPRSAGIGIGVVLGLVGLIWLGSGFYIVQEGQQAVVLTFGRFSHTSEAGFKWRAPYPIQQHETVNLTQLRSVEVGSNAVVQTTGLRESFMLTRDENIVDIRFTVQYRLSDAKNYLFENRSPDEAVVQAAESAVREIVGNSPMDSVLYEQRDAIAAQLVKSIQAQLDKVKAGVLISNVNVQSVQAPEQVQAAFDDAVKAGADRERLKNEGQAYANEVIPKAQGTAARLREEAAGYSARVVAQAEGDAQRFKAVLVEYQKAPAVMRDRMYIDTMQQVYSNVTKVMVDSRQGSNLLYLPLDKLLQASGVAPAASAAAAEPVAAPTGNGATLGGVGTLDPRSRDGSRSRDRDAR
jgi:membrane protease subunit HflK